MLVSLLKVQMLLLCKELSLLIELGELSARTVKHKNVTVQEMLKMPLMVNKSEWTP